MINFVWIFVLKTVIGSRLNSKFNNILTAQGNRSKLNFFMSLSMKYKCSVFDTYNHGRTKLSCILFEWKKMILKIPDFNKILKNSSVAWFMNQKEKSIIICFCVSNIKILVNSTLICYFSKDFANFSILNFAFWWMWVSNQWEVPYFRCINILSWLRNVEESVDTWVSR